tara:strand:- start:2831 stop:3574 length:744 start_codon:yes stop_codon:yes gene_type:complete
LGISQIQDKFYEKVHPFKSGDPKSLLPGQIAWVPTQFFDGNMIVVEVDRAQRDDHNNVKFKFTRMKASHFQKNEEKLPIPNIKLGATEELMAFKTKKRPCIFLGKAEDINLSEGDLKKLAKGKKHLFTTDCLFLPIYSTHKEDLQKGFPIEFVTRIKHFLYSHLLYLPSCNLKNLETLRPPKNEGIVRLDRLFVTSPIVPNVSPTDVMLESSYFKILKYHVKEYLFKETDPNLKDLRELLEEAYNDL